MKERPILFSAPMVRALLAGRKTQTRRAMKPQPEFDGRALMWGRGHSKVGNALSSGLIGKPSDQWLLNCPYGAPGDQLWVREAWTLHERFSDVARVVYRASERQSWTEMSKDFPASLAGSLKARPFQEGWRPSTHMPRWASRLSLEVTEVRVQRLQDISRDDAAAEGLVKLPASGRYVVAQGDQYFGCASHDPRRVYSWLWDQINGKGAWDANPFVWAVSFEVIPSVAPPSTGAPE